LTLLDGLRGQLSSDAGGEIRNLGANSNGAALLMRLVSNSGDDLLIKGIVTKVTKLLADPPRSGPGDLNYNQPGTGGPQVSILNIMGTSDTVIPYDGGSSGVFGDGTSFQLMTALESMSTWSAHNGCDGTSLITSINYNTNADSNGEATFYDYQGCPEGVIVEHYMLLLVRGIALDRVRRWME
jgi:poly(3-hydroxybutyrate) depolymerase